MRLIQQPADAEELILKLLSLPALLDLVKGFDPGLHAKELTGRSLRDESRIQAVNRARIADVWSKTDRWIDVPSGLDFLDAYLQQAKPRPWDLTLAYLWDGEKYTSTTTERYELPSADDELSCQELIRGLAKAWGLAGDAGPRGRHYTMILIRGGYAWSCYTRATAVERMIANGELSAPLVVGMGAERMPKQESEEAFMVRAIQGHPAALTEAQLLRDALERVFGITDWEPGPEGLDSCQVRPELTVLVPNRETEDGHVSPGERLHRFLCHNGADIAEAVDVKVLQVTCPPYRLLRHLELLRACQAAGLDWKIETIGVDPNIADIAENVDPIFPYYVPRIEGRTLNLLNEIDAALVGMSRTLNLGYIAPTAICSDSAQVEPSATIRDAAQVLDRARIFDGARISGNAMVSGDAFVSGRTTITDHAVVTDQAEVTGNVRIENVAMIGDKARVYGNQRRRKVTVGGSTKVSDEATVTGNAHVSCQQVSGRSWVFGNAWLGGSAQVRDDALVTENARVQGRARILEEARIYDRAVVDGAATVGGMAEVCGDAHVGGLAYVNGRANIAQSHHVQVATLPSGLTVTVFRASIGPNGGEYEANRVFVKDAHQPGGGQVIDPGVLDDVEERAIATMEELVLAPARRAPTPFGKETTLDS